MKTLKNSIIIILHFIYLAWILYILSNAGTLTTEKLIIHFIGMALFGAFLIRGTAFIVKRDYQASMRRK